MFLQIHARCLVVCAATVSFSLGQTAEPPVPVSVTVTPRTSSILAGGQILLRASVTGSLNSGVTWNVSSGEGSISPFGLYTAPAAVSEVTAVIVTATSVADGTRMGVSVVTVNPAVGVVVSPAAVSIAAGGTVQLSASQAVTWSLNPALGSISQNGLYRAPAAVSAATAVTVTATSVADGTKGFSVVMVSPAVGVAISPATVSLSQGQTQIFSATLTGTADTRIFWTANPAGQNLSISGNAAVYTAPGVIQQPSTVDIIGISAADSTKLAKARISLVPAILLTLTPSLVSLKAGESKQFSAVVSGTANTAVIWSVDPAGVGTITSSGLYRAPAQVAAAQRVRVKATSVADPSKSAASDVDLNPSVELSFTLNNNGLETLVYKGINYNYKYGEGLLQSIRYGDSQTFVYGPPCTRSLSGATLAHQCTTGPVNAFVSASYTLTGPNTIAVDISITNQSATATIGEANFSTLGISISQFDTAKSNVNHITSDNPLASLNYGSGRYLTWLDTPGIDNADNIFCGFQYICKYFPRVKDIRPGETKRIRISGRFTTDLTSSLYNLAPEAYQRYAEAFPQVINWPDRRPIMAWWIAEGTKKSPVNPRGYLQDSALDVSNGSAFRQRVLTTATQIRDKMNARPVRPQGLVIWDLEGQEFIHPTTYIGDPRVFQSGYAAEMNAVTDEMFRIFTDAGYRIGVTVRPQFMGWGTQLPSTCTYDQNHDYKSYYIKVDNSYGQRFHACYDPLGVKWSIIPESNGGQTIYKRDQVPEVTNLLKSKVDYAHRRWGATLFYIDSAVWSGGAPIESSIIRELQRQFPDCLFIPEQESMSTIGTAIPYTDPRVSGDAKLAPLTWRWAYPTGAFAVAMGDCQGNCWDSNLWAFNAGQKIGDIAVYAQPIQLNPTHLSRIETMITTARQESSTVIVTDSTSGAIYTFRGDVTAVKPYPVKMRVYFAGSALELGASSTYCEAGQWLGENTCTLDLSAKAVSEIRYYDFTNVLVQGGTPASFR